MCCLVRVSHTKRIGHRAVVGSGGMLISRQKGRFSEKKPALVPLRPSRIWDEFTRNWMWGDAVWRQCLRHGLVNLIWTQLSPFPLHLLADQNGCSCFSADSACDWATLTEEANHSRLSSRADQRLHQLRAHLWKFDYLYRKRAGSYFRLWYPVLKDTLRWVPLTSSKHRIMFCDHMYT
jgi:hypothetical protein